MKKILVLLIAAAFVVAFTAPAMSAEWSFYGSSRMSTFWDDFDAPKGGIDDEDLTWSQQGNSRIGANVSAGDVTGGFEYGTGVNLRKLYGEWDFGAGKLLVGQTYTPINFWTSVQVHGGDAGLLNTGGTYDGRRDMIRFTFGGLRLAFIEPSTSGLTNFVHSDKDTTIPKIEARYRFNLGAASASIAAGYNTCEVINANFSEDVDSWIVGGTISVPIGPAYVKGDVHYGENTGNFGLWQMGAASAVWDAGKSDVVDNETLGFALAAGFKMSDMVKFEAGYSYLEHELDQRGADKDDTQAYYLQAALTLAKNVYIVPEIGAIDAEDDAAGNDEGETTYFGAKWQINF